MRDWPETQATRARPLSATVRCRDSSAWISRSRPTTTSLWRSERMAARVSSANGSMRPSRR
ncbi:MAG: hypothetical protein VB138_07055 [Burkholderia sp.]